MKPMNGKPDVEIIQPTARRGGTVKTAPYCRVSSKSDDQLHSYAAQIDYYTKMVSGNPDWELVDIYADRGLTGTEMEHREDLNRLLADCRKGKIDKVLVKSFSRLARNTVDSLTIVRDLKLMGVSVRSERERIDTGDMANEMLVMLWANMAQEESNSISRNLRWSYQKRMRRGEFITCTAPYGYRLDGGKALAVEESEAETVRWIFEQYLDGMGTTPIAQALDRAGTPTPQAGRAWHHTAVLIILKNEKYIGDTLAQKTYTTDDFPFVRKPNRGEKDQYYISNTHPAIISRDVFEKAQALMDVRGAPKGVAQKQYPLSRKLVCAECGAAFKRRQSKSGHVSWSCRRHDGDKDSCAAPRIAETAVCAAFTRMARKLHIHADVILAPALTQLYDLQSALRRGHSGLAAVRQELADLTGQAHTLSRLRSQNLLDDAAWQTHSNEISARRFELRRQLRILLDEDDLSGTIAALEQLAGDVKAVGGGSDGFDTELFGRIVQKAVVGADGGIRFLLPAGIEITERLDEV